MKKTVCTLLALALAGAAFTSCSKSAAKRTRTPQSLPAAPDGIPPQYRPPLRPKNQRIKPPASPLPPQAIILIHESIYVEAQEQSRRPCLHRRIYRQILFRLRLLRRSAKPHLRSRHFLRQSGISNNRARRLRLSELQYPHRGGRRPRFHGL